METALIWIAIVITINWVIPFLLSFTYAAIMTWIFKDYVFEGIAYGMLCFRLVNPGAEEEEVGDPLEPWHVKLWLDWGGLALMGVMFYRDKPGERDDAWVARTKVHEGNHGMWSLILGAVIYFSIYGGHMLGIFVTQKVKGKPYTKHPYYDCVFERLARGAAGQIVNLTPDQWTWGKKDLWPWW